MPEAVIPHAQGSDVALQRHCSHLPKVALLDSQGTFVAFPRQCCPIHKGFCKGNTTFIRWGKTYVTTGASDLISHAWRGGTP